MESLYQEYKNVAEFRLIYIREAHAKNSRRPVEYAFELDISEHTSFEERCQVAEQLFEDKKLTIPCLIDDMENTVGGLYQGWPDRIFIVRKDGKLAVAADRGPFGFEPALKKAKEWLVQFKQTGIEPELPKTL